MDIESDPIKKNKRKEDIETFLGTELEIIDLCDTSSDEDVTREHMSSVTTSKEPRSRDTRKIIRGRLPSVTEKWNSDVSDVEEEKTEDIQDDNKQDDDEERRYSEDEEGTSDDGSTRANSDDDYRDQRTFRKPVEEPRRGSARAYELYNPNDISTPSKSSQARSKQPQDEDSQVNRSISSTSNPVRQSGVIVTQSKLSKRVPEEDSQSSLTTNITQEKESRRKRRIITDDSQPNISISANTQPQKSQTIRVTKSTSQKATPSNSNITTQPLETRKIHPVCDPTPSIFQREEDSQPNLFTIEERLDETQIEATDRILRETLCEIEDYNKRMAIENANAAENIITEDSQLTNNDEDMGSPILPRKEPGRFQPFMVRNLRQGILPINRITRSQDSATKLKKREMTEEEEDAMDVFSSFKNSKKRRK